MVQDPLREMAGMCAGNSEDALSLQLHPLQHLLDRGERLRFLHRAFVTVVNEVPSGPTHPHRAPPRRRPMRARRRCSRSRGALAVL